MTDEVPRSIDTVVIGAGQAGILMSWHLQRAGRDHVVLDRRETLGGGWQDRWDGFRLVSPNWTSGLPGFPYDDHDPDGFMPRDAMVARVTPDTPRSFGAPVATSTEVTRLGAGRWCWATNSTWRPRAARSSADAVVLAVGGVPPAADPGHLRLVSRPRITQLTHTTTGDRTSCRPVACCSLGPDRPVCSSLRSCRLPVGAWSSATGRVRARGRAGSADATTSGGCASSARTWCRRRHPTPLGRANSPEPRLRFACNPHLSGHGGGRGRTFGRWL